MSDLQIGLVALGVVLIFAVLVFNWWQDRRVRRHMQENFPQTDEDPLLGGLPPTVGRREPGLGESLDVVAESESGGDDVDEVDPLCEAVIDVVFAQPVSGAQLKDATRTLAVSSSKPVRIFAETTTGVHRAGLPAEESCVSIQLAILLANRAGPLTDVEWSRLWTAAQGLAERFDGSVEGPEQDEVVSRAERLDEFCANLDAQVGLVVQLNGAQPLGKVCSVVEDAGFVMLVNQYVWVAESGQARFALMFDGEAAAGFKGASVSRLDLLLDIPNSPSDSQAFSRMAGVGRDLAQRFQAQLVDDQGRPVTESADARIDEQLTPLYERLEQAGFTPGDERTARLFS
ncbi:hypothetical protein G9Q38_07905 [Pusillimonas sp. DMV24BSW_D]|uniref:Cell division protein ZipA n=1 Tax=Neopusillimonas maritima TaxID=2026239 RepID=A0A3A1YTN7_9BURK|nr:MULTISPECIES: cell division protein ZipA C-terminal FtsZ-binding domain-containing protein [Alcaligenaceae]QIM49109.1 hypothetical protein G9Q38_07905 [Pusillimonas sp. DMV24BSW_D]RIY40866.1 hypothetical protein CJP73_08710 [Neopusillimonas maritima]